MNKQSPEAQDWHAADVIAALHKKQITLKSLAAQAGISTSTLSKALRSKHSKGERIIADAIGVDASDIWPSRWAGFGHGTDETPEKATLQDRLPGTSDYHYPLKTADPSTRELGNALLGFREILLERQPELELLAQLEADGHDIMGARIRVLAMYDLIKNYERCCQMFASMEHQLTKLADICHQYAARRGKNVDFSGQEEDCAVSRYVFGDQVR